jgi:hypothetical protein
MNNSDVEKTATVVIRKIRDAILVMTKGGPGNSPSLGGPGQLAVVRKD